MRTKNYTSLNMRTYCLLAPAKQTAHKNVCPLRKQCFKIHHINQQNKDFARCSVDIETTINIDVYIPLFPCVLYTQNHRYTRIATHTYQQRQPSHRAFQVSRAYSPNGGSVDTIYQQIPRASVPRINNNRKSIRIY